MAPTAGGSAAAQQAPRVPTAGKIKAGYLRLVANGNIFLALERGYFREVGVDVEPVSFNSATEQIALLGTGELALGNGALNPGLYNSWGRGIQTLVVADGAPLFPGYGSTWILVRTDLADQIKDWPPLQVRPVSGSTQGSLNDYILRTALRGAGMASTDADIVRIAAADVLPALQNRVLDAGGAAEAFATQVVDAGAGVKWKSGADVLPGTQFAGQFMSAQTAADRPLAVALLYAYLKCTRDFMAGQQDDPAVHAVLEKYSGVPADLIRRATPTAIDVNGEVRADDMRKQQELWLAEGVMTVAVDPAPFVNTEFAAEAVRLLGRATNPPAKPTA